MNVSSGSSHTVPAMYGVVLDRRQPLLHGHSKGEKEKGKERRTKIQVSYGQRNFVVKYISEYC